MSNGGAWEKWWRRILPGADQAEVQRRAKISQDARGGRDPGFGPRGMQERPSGRGGMPDFGSLSDDALKLWQQMIRGQQMIRKAWGDLQGFATQGDRGAGGPDAWRQWAERAGGVARRGAEKGLEYLRTPFTQWGR